VLDFEKCDYGDIDEVEGYPGEPGAEVRIRLTHLQFPKFGNDVRIEKIHQEKSAGLKPKSSILGTSNSISSAPGE
jgi:hypothetical protein